MIRRLIYKLNDWYNARGSWTQLSVLAGFCLAFLLLMWLMIRYVGFDAKVYTTKVPVNIGRSSGPPFKDSLKLKKH